LERPENSGGQHSDCDRRRNIHTGDDKIDRENADDCSERTY
jgi:hypothetical protein